MALKRTIDLAVSAVGLVVLSPLLAVLAGLIKATSPGPVFYRGARVGRGGRTFHIYKFRTMVADAERRGGPSTAADDPRITPVGQWLRRWKLDELPQLINVLKGDMSLVGPRPEVRRYVELYSPEERRLLLALRPGITDWASIWNADEGAVLQGAPDPERAYLERIRPTKLRLQKLYARQAGLRTDLRILACTLVRLARRNWTPPELREYPPPATFSSGKAA